MKRIELMIDSGAYSQYRLQGEVDIDIDRYIAFVRANKEWIAHHISLDVIPRSRDDEREIERAAHISYQQHLMMKRAGLSSIPVLHQNENLNWLRRYLDDGEPTVALGTFNKGVHANPWFDHCFRVLREYPEVRVHGLGLATPMALHRYPWSSVDASTWLLQSAAAQIPCPTFRDGSPKYSLAYDTIGLGDKRRGNHIDLLGPTARAHLDDYLEECGVSIAQCMNDVYGKWRVWIRYFNALAVSAQVDIYLVSAHGKTRDYLIANGAYQHLLSYYGLKGKRTLKPYITGVAMLTQPRS